MPKKFIWLRAETKPHERRTPLVPKHAAELVRAKYKVIVERSRKRIFKDADYEAAGCQLVDAGSWVDAPLSAYVLGIKELPHSKEPLKHDHIYFAHAYKGQDGAEDLLSRFERGKGLLYDLEFLQDEHQHRLTCFSYWAGVAGCAVTLLLWVQKCRHPNKAFEIPEYYSDQIVLIKQLEQELNEVGKPSSLVIGARGRCARGVLHFLKELKLDATCWYKKDTKDATSYPGVFKHNLLFNCIYLTKKITPFVTKEQLTMKSDLSIVADISCDPNGPNNPLPIYNEITSFKAPTIRVSKTPNPIDVMAIDHLPSFLPKESSEDFSAQLIPYLKKLLKTGPGSAAWKQAAAYYHQASHKFADTKL